MTHDQIAQLVEQAKFKNPQAIETLYNTFYDDVYYVCLKLLGNHQNAEDITQDTFLEVFTRIDSLNTQNLNFKGWITKIAANKSINFLKRTNRVSAQTPEEMNNLMESEDIDARPEDTVIDADVKDTLESIMARLPEEQRNALFLFYYEEMTVREIAELYGVSESTIKSRLTYARKFMRKEVEKLEDKGHQLRCLTFLPFIFALFQAEKQSLPPVPHGSIMQSLSSYSCSIPTQSVHNIVSNSTKIGGISMKAKIIAAVAVAGVVAVGGITTAVLLNNNTGKDTSMITESTPYSAVSESSAPSNSTPSTTATSGVEFSVEESAASGGVIDSWKFQKMTAPQFKNSTFKTTKPYANKNVGSSKYLTDLEITTVTPSYTRNVDEIKAGLRNSEYLKSKYQFAEGKNDAIDSAFSVGYDFNLQKHSFYDEFYAYTDRTAVKYLSSSSDLHFFAKRSCNKYDNYQEYSIFIKNCDLTPDRFYEEIAKPVFGEEIGKYLVYAEATEEPSKNSIAYNMSVKIPTPDNKGTYTLNRDMGFNDDGTYTTQMYIDFADKDEPQKTDTEYFYTNDFTGFDFKVPLSDMMEADLGNLDFWNKPATFMDKAFSFGGQDTYVGTNFSDSYDGAYVESIVCDDGSVHTKYHTQGNRISYAGSKQSDIDRAVYTQKTFGLIADIDTDTQGNNAVDKFALNIPTAEMKYSDTKLTADQFRSLSKKQLAYLLNTDEKELDKILTNEETDSGISIISGNTKLKVFGEEIDVKVSIRVNEDASGPHASSVSIAKI